MDPTSVKGVPGSSMIPGGNPTYFPPLQNFK